MFYCDLCGMSHDSTVCPKCSCIEVPRDMGEARKWLSKEVAAYMGAVLVARAALESEG